ncbi:MAG: DUF2254 domain-containing protein [Pseudonocardia sp.]|nr:DUF2254 domain-containing protein [Pseudonocardia sp.]
MAQVSIARVRDRVRSAFWLVSALCAVAAVVLAVGIVSVDELIGDFQSRFLFPGPPEGARSLLGAIITAMITFTGLVFSITVVVLVLTSNQFSPRILRTFVRDRTIQWSLGIFVATFVYAMTVIRTVLGTNADGAFVPRIAVTVAFLLVLASVGLFIVYISHIANMIRVSSIIATIGEQSRRLIEDRYPAGPPPPTSTPTPTLPDTATVVANRRPGVVVSVNERGLTEQARRKNLVVALVPRVGDFVPAGAPLLRVCGDLEPGFEGDLVERVALDDERTMEQDVAFGFRQLVDIAEKALSPALNDPTTACQSVDAMHDLLRRLVTRTSPSGGVADTDGQVRLIVRRYLFDDFLAVAVAEVWHFGRDSTQVPERLTTMLRDLESAARPEHRPAVQHWLAVVSGAAGDAPRPG